jgi:hypothetical protein
MNIVQEVAALQRLSVGQLRRRFAELFGETTQASNRTWLIKRIAWRLQALAEGDLSERARRRAAELARDADLRLNPPNRKAIATTPPPEPISVRVVSLPSDEKNIRDFSGVALLIIDEAARVEDVLYCSVRPMLAVSQGRLAALSTPFGKRGWFHDEWHGEGEWERVKITAEQCPRISPQFLAEERRTLGERWYRQEYGCEFTECLDAVFSWADIQAALSDDVKPLFPEG